MFYFALAMLLGVQHASPLNRNGKNFPNGVNMIQQFLLQVQT